MFLKRSVTINGIPFSMILDKTDSEQELAAISIRKIISESRILPPQIEQQAIADYLDKKCAEIDNVISKKEKLLIELEAYKKSLIYEYVTAKKEVV